MREAVTAAFITGWGATSPLAIDNEPEDMPSSGNFAALTITTTTSQQRTQGAPGTRRVKRNAWATVKLWVPAGERTAGMAVLVQLVRSLLEMVDIASPIAGEEAITTLAASGLPVGTDGRWYIELVRVPFWYAETK